MGNVQNMWKTCRSGFARDDYYKLFNILPFHIVRGEMIEGIIYAVLTVAAGVASVWLAQLNEKGL
jgi:hypothetical protein